jgi:hypothetical protein
MKVREVVEHLVDFVSAKVSLAEIEDIEDVSENSIVLITKDKKEYILSIQDGGGEL